MTSPADRAAERAEAMRLLSVFEDAGGVRTETDILQPAGGLLDLYGEDIRARAFTTAGPDGGELMLRPDFTVPLVRRHMEEGGDPARYAYAGEVFRRQEHAPERPAEYMQVGFELFGGDDPAAADAEVFALFHDALAPLRPSIAIGDIGLITAAVRGLPCSERRRAALLRHIWRPKRFRALLDRFAGRTKPPATRTALLAAADPMAEAGPEIGLRGRAEVLERIEALRADAEEPPIAASAVASIDDILAIASNSADALERLRDIEVDLPAIRAAVHRFERRLAALGDRGIPADRIPFEASLGRSSMEYYDGFVFAFTLRGRPDLAPIATGGRYDALTRVIGAGRSVPAVGGVIRPAICLAGTSPC
ncbi:ATP phosphoribosyltransferase regulatory subunit [Palleronia aestuarii]|uniref:Histidine--tRNA ligase n=1 Tax=Palleronia aestuarii TaxID=568105 RepID=A0A2W7N747_9RHOB|nr:ATP phosphoribosyltransferase regulatory subunit [Palleronia aestuarii]PZX16185.1 ATP phosphoribosyltransferase regulatory subunit [Palleronia aestuarii]